MAQIKSFSFYVKNTDTGEILSPDDLDQFGAPPKGQVIAVQNDSDTGYVIGSFSFPYERYGWGSISDLQDGTFCYTNGKQLFFYDATTLEPLEQKLDFQTPSEPYWHIASVYYDQALKNYAVLYHVSSFPPSSEELPWEVWDDDNQNQTSTQKFRSLTSTEPLRNALRQPLPLMISILCPFVSPVNTITVFWNFRFHYTADMLLMISLRKIMLSSAEYPFSKAMSFFFTTDPIKTIRKSSPMNGCKNKSPFIRSVFREKHSL